MALNEADRRQFDLLVIGSGIAGISAAISAAERGFEVALVTKDRTPYESNTWHAQGGNIGKCDEDTPALLERDVYRASTTLPTEPERQPRTR